MRFGDYHNPAYQLRWSEFDPIRISKDYHTLLGYGDEFYNVHCPAVVYYELDKRNSSMNSAGVVPGEKPLSKASSVAQLWGEQVGGLNFSRQLNLHGYPSYSEGRRHQLTARGLEIKQLIRLSLGLIELQRKDIFPSLGDQLDYLGLRYSVLDVYVRPEDIYIHTGLPLHITVDAVTYRFGDSKSQVIKKIQADPTILRGGGSPGAQSDYEEAKLMYGQEPDLIREVLNIFHLNWPQIQFVAAHGVPIKDLGIWQAEAEEAHDARQEEFEVQSKKQGWGKQARRPFEISGTPIRFSEIELIKFYRAYERVIWDSAFEFISGTEETPQSGFEALGKCLGSRTDIESLNDVAAAAAAWAIGEACQMIASDYDGNNNAEAGSEEDYSQFRDIWEPPVEHEDVHTVAGEYEEAIMRRLRGGN